MSIDLLTTLMVLARTLTLMMVAELGASSLSACGSTNSGGEGTNVGDRQALLDRGIAAGQRGDLDEAETAFGQILENNPNDGWAHFNLGSVYIDRAGASMDNGDREQWEQQAEQALSHFEEALNGNPPGPEVAHLLSGRIAVRLGRPQPARAHLEQFLQSGRGTGQQQSEARQLISQADHLDRYIEGTNRISAHMDLAERESANALERTRSLRQGVVLLEAFVAEEPDNWAAHWYIGKAHQALGDHERAFASFETAYGIDFENPNVGRELAIEAIETGRFERAVALARAAVARSPNDPGLRANLAFALLLSADVAAAAAEIERSHAAAPNDEITRRLRALILDVRDGRRRRPTTAQEAHAIANE